MEKEKSSIDILKGIARKSNWEIEVYHKTVSNRYGVNERNVLIQNLQVKDSFFILSQTTNTTKYRLYSGYFSPISIKFDYKLLIRKRDVIDKLSLRKDRLRFKIGSSGFDSKVYIETNNDIETHKALSSSAIQKEILDFLNLSEGMYIGYNEINPNFTKELEGKQYLSVFRTREWILEKELIDKAFSLGELLKNKLNRA